MGRRQAPRAVSLGRLPGTRALLCATPTARTGASRHLGARGSSQRSNKRCLTREHLQRTQFGVHAHATKNATLAARKVLQLTIQTPSPEE